MDIRSFPLPLLAAVAMPDLAFAYIGPGAGLSAIGSLLAIVAAVAFAIVGFVWFPVKRMLKRRKARRDGEAGDVPPPGA